MKFTVVTLFPNLIHGFTAEGLVGQAVKRGAIEVRTVNPRQFTSDVHHTVDDKAFGGGDGMVMKVEPLKSAIDQLRAAGPCRVFVLTPQGRRFDQAMARDFAAGPEPIVLICGRYAGIDQRVSAYADGEISIGDYILNGGEIAACAIIESSARLRPGVLGNSVSCERDSFSDGALECPQFTRPREFDGMRVPEVLTSGHHENVRRFEQTVSRVRTWLLRPDLGRASENDLAELRKLEDAELKALGLTRTQLERG
jgi:tRNA (guanine37-N1)-methyltransferase